MIFVLCHFLFSAIRQFDFPKIIVYFDFHYCLLSSIIPFLPTLALPAPILACTQCPFYVAKLRASRLYIHDQLPNIPSAMYAGFVFFFFHTFHPHCYFIPLFRNLVQCHSPSFPRARRPFLIAHIRCVIYYSKYVSPVYKLLCKGFRRYT